MSEPTDLLPFFRGRWASRFTDTLTARRIVGFALNDTSGINEATYGDPPQYSGPGLVRPKGPASTQVGQEQIEERGYLVVLPYTANGVGIDDVITVDTSNDASLVGKELVVSNVQRDSYLTARKLDCTENQGGSDGGI